MSDPTKIAKIGLIVCGFVLSILAIVHLVLFFVKVHSTFVYFAKMCGCEVGILNTDTAIFALCNGFREKLRYIDCLMYGAVLNTIFALVVVIVALVLKLDWVAPFYGHDMMLYVTLKEASKMESTKIYSSHVKFKCCGYRSPDDWYYVRKYVEGFGYSDPSYFDPLEDYSKNLTYSLTLGKFNRDKLRKLYAEITEALKENRTAIDDEQLYGICCGQEDPALTKSCTFGSAIKKGCEDDIMSEAKLHYNLTIAFVILSALVSIVTIVFTCLLKNSSQKKSSSSSKETEE